MDIKKFSEYLKEDNIYDTPENYIEQALESILSKIKEMIPEEGEEAESEDEVISFTKAREKGDEKERQQKELSFKDYGSRITNSEISRKNSTLEITIEEGDITYMIFVIIDIKEGMPQDKTKDFSADDVKRCMVKMKKYDFGGKQIGSPVSKNIDIKDFDENFLIDMKLQIDGDEKEDIGIEVG
jgi:hypothetical protein